MEAIGDLPESVLEITQDSIVDPLLNCQCQMLPQRAVNRGPGLIVVLEQKRQIDETQFRHLVGQVAARSRWVPDSTRHDLR